MGEKVRCPPIDLFGWLIYAVSGRFLYTHPRSDLSINELPADMSISGRVPELRMRPPRILVYENDRWQRTNVNWELVKRGRLIARTSTDLGPLLK